MKTLSLVFISILFLSQNLLGQNHDKEILLGSFFFIQQNQIGSARTLITQLAPGTSDDSLYFLIGKRIENDLHLGNKDIRDKLRPGQEIYSMAFEASRKGNYDWAIRLLHFLKDEVPDSLRLGYYTEVYFNNMLKFEIGRNHLKKNQPQQAKSLFLEIIADTVTYGISNIPYWPSSQLTNIYLNERKYDSAAIFLQISQRFFVASCSGDRHRHFHQNRIQKARIYTGIGLKGKAIEILLPYTFSPDIDFDEVYLFEEEFPLKSLTKLFITSLADTIGKDSLQSWFFSNTYLFQAKDSLWEQLEGNRFTKNCSSCILFLGSFPITLWDKEYYFDMEKNSAWPQLLYTKAHCEEAIFQSLFWEELSIWANKND